MTWDDLTFKGRMPPIRLTDSRSAGSPSAALECQRQGLSEAFVLASGQRVALLSLAHCRSLPKKTATSHSLLPDILRIRLRRRNGRRYADLEVQRAHLGAEPVAGAVPVREPGCAPQPPHDHYQGFAGADPQGLLCNDPHSLTWTGPGSTQLPAAVIQPLQL